MKTFLFTNIGPRSSNEDNAIVVNNNGIIYACVADGVGGSNNGGFASQFTIERFKQKVTLNNSSLKDIADSINEELIYYALNNLSNTSAYTTFSAVAISTNLIEGIHVGDSRICILRGNGIKQLTEEHNEAGRLIREGKLKVSDKRFYPRRHIIEKIMGNQSMYHPQSIVFDLNKGDRILISSDGFHDLISKIDIRDISVENIDFNNFTQSLVSETMTRDLFDNTTFISIEID